MDESVFQELERRLLAFEAQERWLPPAARRRLRIAMRRARAALATLQESQARVEEARIRACMDETRRAG